MRFPFIKTVTLGIDRQNLLSKTGSRRFFGLLLGLLFCLAPSMPTAALQCPSAAVSRELTAARKKLALSERTRDRVSQALRALKQSGRVDAGMLRDYTTYLQRVQDLVDENRRLVHNIEALCAPDGGTAAGAASGPAGSGSPPPPETEQDELAALDRRLQDSLAAFDEMLLKRLDAIQAASAEKMRDLARQAAQAAERARQGGGGAGSASGSAGKAGAGGGKAQGEKGSRQGPQGKDAARGGRPGTPSASGGKGSAGAGAAGPRGDGQATAATRGQAGSAGAATPGAYNPDDDDIVARQLREAAEQETDPELKKKLWKEYEAYKKNSRP